MPRPLRSIVLLPLALLTVACGTSRVTGETRDLPVEAAPGEVTGVITGITTGDDRSDVTAFILDASGEDAEYELMIDPEVEYWFDLAHLFEHQETGDPVLVEVDDRSDALYALRIDDAPVSPGSTPAV